MGLTIYYRLKAKVEADGARKMVSKLHRFVSKLPFDEVTPIFECDPPDGRYRFKRRDTTAEERRWKPGSVIIPRKRADGKEEFVSVPSLHVIYFMANLRGSETATFGLASHPPVVVHREDVITYPKGCSESRQLNAGKPIEFPTRLRGWYSFSDFCKTQYAANPKYGGVPNFLKAHLSVFKTIDYAKQIGLKTYIRDGGLYWKHHDETKLLAELKKLDELIAGFTGRLSDALSGKIEGTLVAPIKSRPDFEHLEAKGVKRLKAITDRTTKRARKK